MHFFLFFLFFIMLYKSKRVFGIETTLSKCEQMFSLPESMYKTELGRVKVNRTNVNPNILIKTE